MDGNIVVALDLTEPHPLACGFAELLACRSGMGVRLVTVSFAGSDRDQDEFELQRIAKETDAPDVTVEAVVANEVVPALLEATGPDDILCLETRARGPLGDIVVGSVAAEVLRKTSRPVVLVGPAARIEPSYGRLEVCIDGPDAAGALLPVAAEWTGRFGLIPRLVSVWAPGVLRRFPTPEAAQEQLEQMAGRLTVELCVDVGWELLSVPAAPEAIVDDAERHQAAIVAVGVRHHPLLQRVLGSTALAVAHTTTAAVLAVPCPLIG